MADVQQRAEREPLPGLISVVHLDRGPVVGDHLLDEVVGYAPLAGATPTAGPGLGLDVGGVLRAELFEVLEAAKQEPQHAVRVAVALELERTKYLTGMGCAQVVS